MSRQSLAILSRLTIVIAVMLLALPLLSCSEDDDTPTGVQLPEGLYFNPANHHYYEAVSGGFTWAAARDSAATATYDGLAGHLVCVDDEAENVFIYNELGKDVQRFWLGGLQDANSPDFAEPAGAGAREIPPPTPPGIQANPTTAATKTSSPSSGAISPPGTMSPTPGT